MTTTPAELEARVRAPESRSERTDDELTAIMDTVLETRGDVKALRLHVDRLGLDVDALARKVGALHGLPKEVGEVRQDLGRLRRAVQALLDRQGPHVEPSNPRANPVSR